MKKRNNEKKPLKKQSLRHCNDQTGDSNKDGGDRDGEGRKVRDLAISCTRATGLHVNHIAILDEIVGGD